MSRSSTAAERRRAGAAALALLALAPALALAQSRGERIEMLEQRMDRAERQLESQALLEMARQLEAQQDTLRRLTGEVDALRHEIERLQQQQRQQYLDLDGRLQAAEQKAAAAATVVAQASDPAVAYQSAFEQLKAGRYDEAEQGLGAFLAQHPEHELAANAQYWLGEIAYVRRDYTAALAAFERVLGAYPDSRKGADALLKIGYSEYELRRYDRARAALERIGREHPDTPAAVEAAERLRRLAAEGR